MPIDEKYKNGIIDLFTETQNKPVLLQLSKSITRNVCDIDNDKDAIEYIFTYVNDIHTLLNKRHITKEMLFRYLHKRAEQQTSTEFTKSHLINQVISYWNTQYGVVQDKQIKEDNFPIHLLARQFAEWFFDNYNKNTLKSADFWSDSNLELLIIASDETKEYICNSSDEMIKILMEHKMQFGFYFNPNLTHAGVQGRIDIHGLVLVLACGTLHTKNNCVGVFECCFGLLRDPFTENNWKAKKIKCSMRSEVSPQVPSLCDSNSLKRMLTLPAPTEELN